MSPVENFLGQGSTSQSLHVLASDHDDATACSLRPGEMQYCVRRDALLVEHFESVQRRRGASMKQGFLFL